MEDEKKWNNIDDYLLDRLNPTQRKEFENRLKNEKGLQDDVDLHKELIQGMEAYDDKQQFLKILQEEDKEETPVINLNKSSKKRADTAAIKWLRPFIGIAASITILLLAGLYLWPKKVNLSQLANNKYERAEDNLTAQLEANGLAGGLSENQLSNLHQGIEAFNSNNLTLAKDKFDIFKKQTTAQTYTSVLVDFYLAQIAWEAGNYEGSFDLLSPLSNLENLPITNEINYYQGLNYLKQGNTERAKSALEKIPSDHKWYSNAAEILHNLK